MKHATVCAVASLESCCSAEQCVDADSDGRFVLPEQPTSVATLVASAAGYVTAAQEIDTDAESSAQEIRLEPDPRAASLAGAVHDLYGGSIAGAVVSTTSDDEEDRGGATLSRADGSFIVTARRGEGRVCARAEAYSRVCNSSIAPSDGNTLVLMPKSAIVGRVVTAGTGEAVADAIVRASNRNGSRLPDVTTRSGPDGSFAFDALPPGGYALAAVSEHRRSAEARVALGVGETSQPVILTASPAVRFSGTVLLGDRPCSAGEVVLSGPVHAFERLSSDGTVSVDGLLPGQYQALAVCRGRPSGTLLDVANRPLHHEWTFEDDRKPPESEDQRARNLNEPSPAPRGGTIKVTVSNPETIEEPLRLFANARRPMPLEARRNGSTFIFDELAEGEYHIHAFDDVEHPLVVRIHSPGEIVEIQMALLERGAISGRVLAEDGRPVSEVWVSPSRAALPGGNVMVARPTLTDEDGAFTVGVTAGAPYSIVVNGPAGDARLEGVRNGDHIEIRLAAPVALSTARAP